MLVQKRERPAHYTEKNPPPDINSALDRITSLRHEIPSISLQIAEANLVIKDHGIPWGNPMKKEMTSRKSRAGVAQLIVEKELAFLNQWIRQQRRGSLRINRRDTNNFLVGARNLLQKLASSGTRLEPDERELLDQIDMYLGIS